jgi:DNA-binding FrmR family transcriptional regulator
MTHTIREKNKLLARVRRIRGQVEALERGLAAEAGCDEVMHQIVGIRGAVTGLMAEVVEDHVRSHLVNPPPNAVALDASAAEQLIDVMHSYLR